VPARYTNTNTKIFSSIGRAAARFTAAASAAATAFAAFAALALSSGCEKGVAQAPPPYRDSKQAAAAPPPARPIEVQTVDVPGDLPAFVLHGAPDADPNTKMVFLHGRCTHGLGYLQSFQFPAAKRGTAIALQGDQACGDTPLRRWSLDIEKINARIEAAFQAAGYTDPAALKEILVMGYSEGSSRAEALAARYPERYSRVILIGAPVPPSAARLGSVRGAVMMSGDRDAQERMKQGHRSLTAAGVPSVYMVLPNASHGEMGPQGERVMGEAIDWLLQNAAPPGPRTALPAK
jgi:predicted esterase